MIVRRFIKKARYRAGETTTGSQSQHIASNSRQSDAHGAFSSYLCVQPLGSEGRRTRRDVIGHHHIESGRAHEPDSTSVVHQARAWMIFAVEAVKDSAAIQQLPQQSPAGDEPDAPIRPAKDVVNH